MYTLLAISVLFTPVIYAALAAYSAIGLWLAGKQGKYLPYRAWRAGCMQVLCAIWMYVVRASYAYGKERAAALMLLALFAAQCLLAAAEYRRTRLTGSWSRPAFLIPAVAGIVPAYICALLGVAYVTDLSSVGKTAAAALPVLILCLVALVMFMRMLHKRIVNHS